MSIISPSRILKQLAPGNWEVKTDKKELFLTFDDGPIPGLTPAILDILKNHQVTATFFCVGDNVRKYPEIYKRILAEGHTVGNHTYSHLKGWKTSTEDYIENVLSCREFVDSKLFRPPYGKITPKQIRLVKRLGFEIIMWSVLSMDFKKEVTPEMCYRNVIDNAKQGSIVVFHDNIKAKENVLYALPKAIKYFQENNFEFSSL